MIDIRPQRPEDLQTDIAVHNAAYPPDSHTTIEEAEAWAQLDTPDNQVVRVLAWEGERAVGRGEIRRRPEMPAGRFRIEVAVIPSYRGRGIARALYGYLRERAEDLGAGQLICGLREENFSVRAPLERDGFREVERRRESELDLTNLHFNIGALEDRLASRGITLTTLASDGSEDTLRRLWRLNILAERDIPFDAPPQEGSFERFRHWIEAPMVLADCLVFARHGDEVIGFTVLSDAGPGRGHTMMTGVHPEYRGLGVATAIKARCAYQAQARGLQAIRTSNHLNNPAMLAVNRRLGYRRRTDIVRFVKDLTSDG